MTPPLSHHMVLALAEPFHRAGFRVDLGASDRLQGRLVLRPTSGPAAGRESLALEPRPRGGRRLVRTVRAEGGACATLELMGAEPPELLRALDRHGPQRQFEQVGEALIARHDRLHLALPLPRPEPVGATVQLGALKLAFRFVARRASFRLAGWPREAAAPPDDLFAVLGWRWGLLREERGQPAGCVRLPAGDREAAVLRTLREAAGHLQRLREAGPQGFAARWQAERFSVGLRRALPATAMASTATLLAAAPLLQSLRETPWPLLMAAVPAALLAAALHAGGDGRFEAARWPRPLPPGSPWLPR